MANVIRADGSTTANDNEVVGWALEPSVRGTAALVFTCISTVIICTWSAVHMNVGKEGMSHEARLWSKTKCLAVALMAPEYIALGAYYNLNEAKAVDAQMSDYGISQEWSKPLSFFVVMGGVVIRSTDGTRTRLPPDMVRKFVKKGWISLDRLTTDIVQDKSKASWFNKALAGLQISFFLAQLLGRVVAHLSVTTLELFTLAYVACGFLAYGCWWYKPFDVGVPIVLDAPESFTATERTSISSSTKYSEYYMDSYPEHISIYPLDKSPWFASICCGLFGACHILGWNAYFPTYIELILWRIGSVACIALPLSILFWALIGYKFVAEHERVKTTIMIVTLGSYTIVRLLLLFEAFFALRRVPADVYVSLRWNQFMPHF